MIIFGWLIASLGAIGLCGSVILEIKSKERIYMHLMKISCGVLGIGGIIIGISAL